MKSSLVKGHELFKKSYFKNHEKEFLELAQKGQQPKVLFIGCSDSRVMPNLITKSGPGDLFMIRNIGNFVAPFKPDEDFHSTAAAIEYAVSVLKIKEIIICGHTQCGACASLFETIEDPELVHTKHWLKLGEEAKNMAVEVLGADAEKEKLLRLTEQLSVVKQIEHILTYPAVKRGVDAGTIHIHGWVYNLATGDIVYYNSDDGCFESLSTLESK